LSWPCWPLWQGLCFRPCVDLSTKVVSRVPRRNFRRRWPKHDHWPFEKARRSSSDMRFLGDRYIIERSSGPANAMITVLEDASGATTTPSGLATESAEAPTSPMDDTGEGSLISMTLREGRLPVGVTFAEPVTSALVTSEPSATSLRRWSDPIRFEPSGRAQDATIRVAGQRDFVVDVTLRGLTAMAVYSAPTRITPAQASAPTGMAEALP
jgi:hypothetical protein